ncbi:hypothetical protein CYLTODRAFT_433640 [Cylindrobasidium torrendii FP15055 ss-10]|uniref:NAD(P)-binding domain-containing protein n=1 Tax=Cylindrobasidium torrendii FP15055 ss-10 TaxID=1314674 RepID=A0A0D7AS60_9AGAR|nr:hypothetical protein CYLTODRAFT_433640 [Cylindrobasidium torrendii FP15055 ss-10]
MLSTTVNNVLSFGGSRNIGYYSAPRSLRKPIKGDALQEADIKAAWDLASSASPVDLVVFSIGTMPNTCLTKGVIMDAPNLVTQCNLHVVRTIPLHAKPQLVSISSYGVSKHGHKVAFPLLLKLPYSWLLALHTRTRLAWSVPSSTAQNILVLRTALFTDGPCVAGSGKSGKAPYRVTIREDVRGWTISRKDVAHFISVAVTEK